MPVSEPGFRSRQAVCLGSRPPNHLRFLRFWHASHLLPFEGHWGLRYPLRGQTPLSVLNGRFSGPRTACFGSRAFVLHRFLFIFGRYLCFIIRKVTGGWEASNCLSNQLSAWSKVVQHEYGKEKSLRGFTETSVTLCTRGIKI